MEVERTGLRWLITFSSGALILGLTCQPPLQVRVWQGLDKPNLYLYPRPTHGTYPRVSHTCDNPYLVDIRECVGWRGIAKWWHNRMGCNERQRMWWQCEVRQNVVDDPRCVGACALACVGC